MSIISGGGQKLAAIVAVLAALAMLTAETRSVTECIQPIVWLGRSSSIVVDVILVEC